jgi:hypothetical protein
MRYEATSGLSGWKWVVVRAVQLTVFVVFLPALFHRGVSSTLWSFDARLVLAALWAGGCAWLAGAALAALLEYWFRV